MSIYDFLQAVHGYIREEFVAISEVEENTIRVRFVGGETICIRFAN